jgi:polar amino acid transport system substrate-binding protein
MRGPELPEGCTNIAKGLASAVAAMLCLAAPAFASACSKTVRWELQPPYGIVRPDGERAGYYTDVAQEALARMGCTSTLVARPWARGLKELEEGQLDLMPGMLFNRERSRYALFSRGINLSPNLLFLTAAASRRTALPRLADLRDTDLKIAIETGAYYSAEYAALLVDPRFAARLHPVPDRARAWLMLESGRVDGVISDQASALVAGMPLRPVGDAPRPVLMLSSVPARIAFSRRHHDEAFVARFDAAIESMIADGSLLRLRERYVPCPTDPATLGCRSVGVDDQAIPGNETPP